MNIKTQDPVMAVVVHTQKEHAVTLRDHEARLRPLEALKAQVLLAALVGSLVGAALVNYLFART